jgi:ferrous-iron efflux pump FieF
VLASAVDSCLDFLVSAFNAIAVRQAGKPSDESFNYGRGKLEGLAATLEGGFILVSAAYIAKQAIERLTTPSPIIAHELSWATWVMAISFCITAGLVFYLSRASKQARSLILEADAMHYRTDLWTNLGVLASLGTIHLSGWNFIDPMVAMGLAVYIAAASLPLLRKGLNQLLDRSLDARLVERIRDIANAHKEANGMHELRTRLAGDTYFVDFHLVLSENIPLGRAHRISDEIENQIRALEPARWSIQIHLDPVDDSRRDQKLAGLIP